MLPGMTHPPMAPHAAAPAQSPLAAMLMARAQHAAPPQMGHPGGMTPQAPGAPMPLNAGGHPAGRYGHALAAAPC